MTSLTRTLVERRFAAAAHHTPIRAAYTWNGELHDHPETRAAIHTRASLFDKVARITSEEHPYDVACVIALPVSNLSPAYQRLVLDSTGVEA